VQGRGWVCVWVRGTAASLTRSLMRMPQGCALPLASAATTETQPCPACCPHLQALQVDTGPISTSSRRREGGSSHTLHDPPSLSGCGKPALVGVAFTVRGAPTKNAKDPLTKGQGFETVPGLPGMGLGAHKGSALERCNTLHAITPAYHTLATALFPAHPLLGGSGTRGVTSHSPHKPRRPSPP